MNWKPIDTAPKDGTCILLFEKWTDTPFVGYFIEHRKSWYVDMEHISDENGGAYSSVTQKDITHWMPLPEPPK